MSKIRILDISYYMTCPPTSGGALRILTPFENMDASANIEVDFLFSTWDSNHTELCQRYLKQFPVIGSVTGVITRHYLQRHDGKPENFSAEVWETISKELKEKAVRMVQKQEYDIIQIEHSQLAWIVPSLRLASPKSKFVLDLHNAEHLIYKRWLSYTDEDKKDAIKEKYDSMIAWETKTWKWFDAALTVSLIEAEMIKEIGGVNLVYTVPTGGGINPLKYEPTKAERHKAYDILYLGTMEWFPNAQGLLWFIDEVLPHITKKFPDIKFHIVGFGNPNSELYKKAKQHPNIRFWGQQDDDKKFFNGAKVFIVPLWIGAGARVKIPTAWASRVPIVSTTLGAEGLDAKHMKNIILADKPEEFANEVIKILINDQLAREIAENAFDTLMKSYTADICVEKLLNAYNEISSLNNRRQNLKD